MVETYFRAFRRRVQASRQLSSTFYPNAKSLAFFFWSFPHGAHGRDGRGSSNTRAGDDHGNVGETIKLIAEDKSGT